MRTLRTMEFIALSATIHVAVLAIPLPARQAPVSPDSTLHVQLDANPPVSTVNRADPRPTVPARREAHTPLPTSSPSPPETINSPPDDLTDIATSGAVETTSDTAAQAFPEASPASLADADPTFTFALALSYLRDALERNKVYPSLALQRGWEGEVLLAFRVVDDGAIRSVHVARSSGNRLLDRSAVQALQNIERVTPELWRHGENAELQLSVIYRLIKS